MVIYKSYYLNSTSLVMLLYAVFQIVSLVDHFLLIEYKKRLTTRQAPAGVMLCLWKPPPGVMEHMGMRQLKYSFCQK